MNDPNNWQAALDDLPWANLTADVAIMTPGIAALGKEAVDRIIKTIMVFDDFHHAVAIDDERDFGSFEGGGCTIMFKIDLYEEPDVKGANGEPIVTRVLTVMLANEY